MAEDHEGINYYDGTPRGAVASAEIDFICEISWQSDKQLERSVRALTRLRPLTLAELIEKVKTWRLLMSGEWAEIPNSIHALGRAVVRDIEFMAKMA